MGGIGLGLGVRARGLRGMWPTDFLRDGECRVLVFTANLCLCLAKPCSELGLCDAWFTAVTVTGEHGAESVGNKM